MKKTFLTIVSLLVVISAFGQNYDAMRKEAIQMLKLNLYCPTTFVLTDKYGDKAPLSSIKIEEVAEEVDKQVNKDAYTITTITTTYPKHYVIHIHYSAQNRVGGLVKGYEKYYADEKGKVTYKYPSHLIKRVKEIEYLDVVENISIDKQSDGVNYVCSLTAEKAKDAYISEKMHLFNKSDLDKMTAKLSIHNFDSELLGYEIHKLREELKKY